MRSIVLSGFMATGKSTVGPRLAARLGVEFVDTDAEIERESGRSIPALWREEGEASFRRRELALVEKLFEGDAPRVIAFGGGTVTIRKARHLALDRATVITLAATPETILARIGPALPGRPNLNVGGDPRARTRELLSDRADAYAECHAVLSTDAAEPDSIVDAIVAVAERAPILMPLGQRSYVVDLANDSPAALADAIAQRAPSSLLVVTDAHVQRDRHVFLDHALAPLGIPRTTVTLASGEEHKNIAAVATIWDAALGAGVDRQALVVGFGGGVVGDLAGFAASSLLRGVRSLLVPTTLLAMVDASVGGKTGFDHPTGKNLIGSFHQPSGVVVDLAHLSTLPLRERAAGLAEVVKIALAVDAGLLDLLERNLPAVAAGETAALRPIVRRAIEAKIRVVRDDEREEGGRRAFLNFGHTMGHALEAQGGYRKYLHGEAVALGMLVELAAAAHLGWTPTPLVGRVRELLASLGLPTEAPKREAASSLSFLGADKKRVGSRIRWPVVRGVGESTLELIEIEVLRAAILASER